MVLQMPYANKARVFAASSVENEEYARQEIRLWARGNGYRRTNVDRTFTIYRQDGMPREWVLLERGTSPPV